MAENSTCNGKMMHYEEITAKSISGMLMLLVNIALMVVSLIAFIFSIQAVEAKSTVWGIVILVISALYLFLVGPILFIGLKVLGPNEAYVLTLFGKYYGTLKGAGFFFVNPFVSTVNPSTLGTSSGSIMAEQMINMSKNQPGQQPTGYKPGRKVIS